MSIDLLTFLAIGFVAQLVDGALGMAFGPATFRAPLLDAVVAVFTLDSPGGDRADRRQRLHETLLPDMAPRGSQI